MTKEYQAHETAIIGENCKIGKGTKIWHFSHIMNNCDLGEGCNIGQNVVVSPDVKLGNNGHDNQFKDEWKRLVKVITEEYER